jgi:hypothetical protein
MLTQRRARAACHPPTATLMWKRRDRRWFTSDRIWRSCNTNHAGKLAFTARDTTGYLPADKIAKGLATALAICRGWSSYALRSGFTNRVLCPSLWSHQQTRIFEMTG